MRRVEGYGPREKAATLRSARRPDYRFARASACKQDGLETSPMPKTAADLGLARAPTEPASSPHASGDMRAAAADAARVLRAIGSPRRLLILCLLLERPRTVTQICDAINARQSLVSQHLTRLRRDGLVSVQRRGHFADYSITDTVAKEIVDTLYRHYCARDAVRPKK